MELIFKYSGTAGSYLRKYHHSLAHTVTCSVCEGKGWIPFAQGEEDFIKEECVACGSTGKGIVEN